MALVQCETPSVRVRSLASLGSAVEVDHNVPVIRYFRSGKEMMRMADVYYDEHNYENAFILYSKFITIFVEKLPKHPQYKQARPEDIKETKRKVKLAFPKAEDTKTKLKQKFEKEFRIWEEKEKQRLAEEERLRAEREKWDAEQRRKHEEEEEERRRLQELKEKSLMEEQQRQIEEQRQAILLEQQRAKEREEAERRALAASAAAAAAAAAAAGGTSPSPPSPGVPPPSYDAVRAGGYSVYKPAETLPTVPRPSVSPTAPPVDRNLKVDRSTKPTNLLSTVPSSKNRYGLRDLFVPFDTVERFLKIAQVNTTKNLETCGILAGKLSQDAFTITHIVVPKQTSTSDSCTALNEGEIFDVMDKQDLITLGWIHTHPTQTAFMSSIDLHTHCPYQVMMAEAIAIVCAPAHNETGYFSLTPDHGLQFISNCKEVGFHPHPSQPPIYEEGQHVKLASNVSIQIIDMR